MSEIVFVGRSQIAETVIDNRGFAFDGYGYSQGGESSRLTDLHGALARPETDVWGFGLNPSYYE